MKKFLSVVLAVAMIVSLASVAMAKNPAAEYCEYEGFGSYKTPLTPDPEEPFTVEVDDGDHYYPVVGMVGPFGFNAEDRALFDNSKDRPDEIYCAPIEFGDTAYYALLQFNAPDLKDGEELVEGETKGYYSLVSESETVSGLKIKASWEEGKDMIKKISIVKKKVTNDYDEHSLEHSDNDPDETFYYPSIVDLGLDKFGFSPNNTASNYYYFLTITYEDSTSVNDTDIIGTITMNKSKDPSVDELEFDIAMNLDWEKSWRNDSKAYTVTEDPEEFLADTNYALKFDCDDEVEFTFEDDSTFTVDVSGQSKILFNFNTEFNNKVYNRYAYTGAEFNFWNGNGAKFNRVGEFFLSCDDLEGNQFLYQVNSDGTLSEVPGAEWDDSDEGFYFNTRVLGSYVVSDVELELKPAVKPAAPSAPVVSAPVISNPSTGAAA